METYLVPSVLLGCASHRHKRRGKRVMMGTSTSTLTLDRFFLSLEYFFLAWPATGVLGEGCRS